jgi:hypothetical protein
VIIAFWLSVSGRKNDVYQQKAAIINEGFVGDGVNDRVAVFNS